jgi:serine/threonine protein kinase
MDQQPTWIGRTLSGRYRIESMLGQGGMSAVYKANDPNLKRVVAIKLIHPHLSSDPSFVLRFESEASAVASLRHPNIVQVYDFNSDGGVYYMVLEFIPGETLQDRMKRLADVGRQLPIEEAVKFTANISDAVGYAHQRGLVHRDIKPANIMLDVQGQAILMDFGIVKILGGDSHTTTGAVVGTARYMSPEIIRGEVADHRSDIYSLGVTLYEMLSGRPPYVADSAMTLMMMHLNDPVPNVRNFREEIPADLADVHDRCLAKDRTKRYQSATELSADLRRALSPSASKTFPRVANVGQMQTIAAKMDPMPAPSSTGGSQSVPPPTRVTGSQALPTPVQTTGSQQYPSPGHTSSSASYPAAKPTSTRPLWLAGGGFLVLACLVIAVVVGRFVFNSLNGASNPPSPTLALATSTTAATEAVGPVVDAATETVAPTDLPTDTPAPTLSPTPEGPFVVITEIRVDGNLYVVDYEPNNLEPSQHVHIFFDTVPPEQAGAPGSGPWKLTWNTYGNPPFTQYGIGNRPAGATKMCALVANSNHTVIMGSGNCVFLPE